MDRLIQAIHTTSIIDHHAHNLLVFETVDAADRLGIFSEAQETALEDSRSALPHIRGVRQLAQAVGCAPDWESVKTALEKKNRDGAESWARHCFSGIETVLIDDGFMSDGIYPYDWHSRLVRSKCKRVVRIEVVAEEIIDDARQQVSILPMDELVLEIQHRFRKAIEKAIYDPEVAGFKSVICYRTGLAIPAFNTLDAEGLKEYLSEPLSEEVRLEHEKLCPFFVHLTAKALDEQGCKKPFQFHTGLGDWDINLHLGSPVHMQKFLEWYEDVVIVFLHASWPFTKEASYLAAVYPNTYLDIGEVFPHISQDGQERMIRESLDICPSGKLLWSTDAHSFAETYLLATLQVKEGLEKVLGEYLSRKAVTVDQAITIVQDLFFTTANRIYSLGLELKPIEYDMDKLSGLSRRILDKTTPGLDIFEHFLQQHSTVKYLRLQWVDYTATVRVRILPIKQAIQMLEKQKYIGITKAALGLLQMDVIVDGFDATGEYNLVPMFNSLRLSSRSTYANVQCEFQQAKGEPVDIDPRTVLRRQVQKASDKGITYLVGFEIEVVFLHREVSDGHVVYGRKPVNMEGGHSWSALRALHDDKLLGVVERIVEKLDQVGIDVMQFHSETAPGQYEFALGALPPLEAVDTLIAARDIIFQEAASADLRATLYPKPYPNTCGTGAHVHLSLQPEDKWPNFYAGILKSLPAISAFTYSNDASYERVVDEVWAGSTWICWGPQNRETPLRQICASHFEIKCVDGLAQPYLSLAAILAAGLHGINNATPLDMKPCLRDPAQMNYDERHDLGISKAFPNNIAKALGNLEDDPALRKALGEEVLRTYEAVKMAEKNFLSEMDAEKRRNWLIERY